MPQWIGLILIIILVNLFATFRFVISSGFSKGIIIFSLICLNVIICVGYWIYYVGIEKFNSAILIVFALVGLIIMFVGFYKLNNRK